MRTTLYSLVALCTTAIGFGQCDLLDQPFDGVPIFTPITAVSPAWTNPGPTSNVPRIAVDSVGNIALRLANDSSPGQSVARRDLTGLNLPSFFRLSFQVQADIRGAFLFAQLGAANCLGDTLFFEPTANPPQIRLGSLAAPMITGVGLFNTVELYHQANGPFTILVNGTVLATQAVTCGIPDVLQFNTAASSPGEMWIDNLCIATQLAPGAPIGQSYCSAVPNRTGQVGSLRAFGSAMVADNNVILAASSLPPMEFGFFLTSPNQGFLPNAGGSSGNLCLNGPIGRYISPGQVMSSGPAGVIIMNLDLTQTPTPASFVSVMAGGTQNWQLWHRENMSTSNYTEGLSITFN